MLTYPKLQEKRQGASQKVVTPEEVEQAVTTLLLWMGEDPSREGLQKTPERVRKALAFLSEGYQRDLQEVVNGAIFEEPEAKGMVFVGGIDIFSTCEHHILPIIGKAYVAYIPHGKVLGLSKLARICEMYARRLQLQERIVAQVAEAIEKAISPLGVAVMLEASHMCMAMRGVQKVSSFTTTTSWKGVFETDAAKQMEFFQAIQNQKIKY